MWNCGPLLSLALTVIITIEGSDVMKPRLGASVNEVKYFGTFKNTMRVMLKNVSDEWIFRTQSFTIFKLPKAMDFSFRDYMINPTLVYCNVHIAYCTGTEKLVQEFFSDYKIEGMTKPWYAFTPDWSTSVIANLFGLNETFLTDSYRYVLLKIVHTHDTQAVCGPVDEFVVEDSVATKAALVVNRSIDVSTFVMKFGTHYISSYSTGDSLYQVFVYTPSVYDSLQADIKKRGIDGLTKHERNLYFSPAHAVHVGQIQSSSGNPSFEKWAIENLRTSDNNEPYSSLIYFYGNYTLLEQIDQQFQDRALLRLDVKIMTPVFRSSRFQGRFRSYVSRYEGSWFAFQRQKKQRKV